MLERSAGMSYLSRDMMKKILLKHVSSHVVEIIASKGPESQVYNN